jgi:hypothetical protein
MLIKLHASGYYAYCILYALSVLIRAFQNRIIRQYVYYNTRSPTAFFITSYIENSSDNIAIKY